jgi:hypothetical protein
MANRAISLFSMLRILILLALGMGLASCGTLQRAAPYDPNIEQTVSEFNVAVLTHIAKMQGLSKLEKGAYGENIEFYTTWKIKLEVLRNLAIAQEVGNSCGPEQITDDIIKGGFKKLGVVLQKAQSQIDAVKIDSLNPAKDWIGSRRDKVKAELKEAETKLNAASAASADFARLEARVVRLTDKFERWYAASSRVTAAIVELGKRDHSKSFEGGCTTRLVTNLAEQFAALERFHMKQKDLGIPPRRAPAILMSVPIQVILKVQQRKKVLSGKGLL